MRALLAGDYDTAIELLAEELDARPDDSALRCNYGAALHAVGRYADAADQYRRAIEAGGEPAALLSYNLASALAASGDDAGAEVAYERAIELDPGLAEAHGNLAVLRYQRLDLDRAEAGLRRAIELAPDDPTTRCNLGAVLSAAGRGDDAVDAYRAALGRAPADAEVVCGLAGALCRFDRHREAIELIETWDGEPTHDVMRHLAAARAGADDYAGAEAVHRELLDADAGDAWAWNGLGTALEAMSRRAEARDAFERALELAPDWADAHYNLGVSRERDELYEAAAESYQRALELAPTSRVATKNLAGVLRVLGRDDESRAAYARALELDPDDQVAGHLYASMCGAEASRAPAGYVRDVFDDYAAHYDDHMVEQLGYTAPGALVEVLAEVAGDARFERAVDLGCGTGLMGRAVRGRVGHLTGVDLSPGMLARCADAGYDQLACADLVDHLGSLPPASVDLLSAADVLIYLGDLGPIFAAAGRALAPGGAWLFSVELAPDGDYQLTDTGRFVHGLGYLERLCAGAGLALAATRPVTLRHERGEPVAGLVACARKA